jgi:hypothetical protein
MGKGRCSAVRCAPVAPLGSKGKRAAGGCSAVRCSACVKEQTRAKGSKSQIKADAFCKQGERRRSPSGKGLPCKAGMRTKGKTPLPRENLVTHLDKSLPTGVQLSEWAGRVTRQELLSSASTDSAHVCQVRGPYRYPRLYIKGSRYRGLTTNLGPRLAIGKPTPVTCLSGWGAQGSTGAESSEWKPIYLLYLTIGLSTDVQNWHDCNAFQLPN